MVLSGEAPNRTPVHGPVGSTFCCQPWSVAPRWCRRAEKRGIQVTEVRASDVHVRPATRADAPGIVWVSTSSILPGEDVGFGGRIDSPFHDASMLAAVWQDPNVVQGEEVLVAEMDGRISAARPSRTEEENSSSSTSTSCYSFRAEASARCSCGQSRCEPEQKARRQLLPARVGTQRAWLGDRFPGGNTSGTRSPMKR
jgi:hypothetical protein